MADCGPGDLEEYDLPLHIGAIFILMGVALIGTLFPVIGRSNKVARIPTVVFQCLKLFGTGVILSTALVHMFIPATLSLTNSCVPSYISADYTGFAGAIALGTILLTQMIQGIAARKLEQIHSHEIEHADPDTSNPTKKKKHSHGHSHGHGHSHSHKAHQSPKPDSFPSSPSFENLEKGAQVELPEIKAEDSDLSSEDHHAAPHDHDHDQNHVHGLELFQKQQQLSTIILEIGIAMHSVIIGITLGVTRGTEFVSLLVAIAVHQTFEGIALASVVMETKLHQKKMIIILVIFYCLTTPIGIAIGVGTNAAFNQNSEQFLLTTGVLDAISAGILLYDGLVNIVHPHFTSNAFKKASAASQVFQYLALWIGAAGMSLIGRWA